jgi:DNA-binding MarR family transcriptional regulator
MLLSVEAQAPDIPAACGDILAAAVAACTTLALTIVASASIIGSVNAYDPQNYLPRESAPGLMGRVRMALFDALDAELEPLGLKATDYVVLVALANEATTASSICASIAHDPGAMTRKIDALEKKGLVRRVRSETDRRAIRIELTPEARKLYPRAVNTVVGVVNDFLHGFSRTEVRELESMLKRILANAEAREATRGKDAA